VGDFGVSNWLHNSRVKTNVGTQCYQAPERINALIGQVYGCEADVWSLGITLVELARLQFPYDLTGCTFAVINSILTNAAPTLPGGYGQDFVEFVSLMLVKEQTGQQP
jgi:serine/threonine protein kinase